MLQRLDSLTGLRFLAALYVVLLHSLVSRDLAIAHLPFVSSAVSLGALGVAFFFVLSGFVLTWSARPGDRVRDFYRRRFARVYPMHVATWVATGLALLAAGTAVSVSGAVLSLGLLQAWVPDPDIYFAVNGVSWSLSCEAFFYAVHPVLLVWLFRRRLRPSVVAITALALMAAAAILQMSTTSTFASASDLWVFPPFALGEFVVGMAVAVAMRDGYRLRLPLPAAGLLAFAALGILTIAQRNAFAWFGGEIPQTIAGLLFVPAVALVILAAASADLRGERSFVARPTMVRLGEWSFALYLIHTLILRGLVDVVGVQPSDSAAVSLVVELVFLVAAVATSGIAYKLLEQPLERRLRPKGRRPRATAEVPAPAKAQPVA